MAIRHVVLFSFKPEADEAAVGQVIGQLNELPGRIAEIREWSIREDLGKRDYSSRFALIAVFDDMDALGRYMNHPAHVRVLDTAMRLVRDVVEHDHET
ncbi:MAG: Dabb family protein [Gemmatimonadaceae bacterium]|nr:Dabb family protein [Gemmatimonadaceae bacterium]